MPTSPGDPAAPDAIDAELERILTSFDSHYTWRYGDVSKELRDLYEKSVREQWNATTELPWETSVDPEDELVPAAMDPLQDYAPFRKLPEKERTRFRHATLARQLSQFLHGGQGALLAASQLVGAVPWMEAKHYAASQTLDEARHVEVFSRYLHEKLEWEWPIDPNLKQLLDAVLLDGRWDFKYLGMQILVEGLAMAAFANLYQMADEPLLQALIHNVMRDEARHVAFGVLSLEGYYADMPGSERRDREDFIVEASLLMRDRLVGDELADVVGFDRRAVRAEILASPLMRGFRRQLFARVVPNVKRLGLLTPRVRAAWAEMEILHFEDRDPEAWDRALGL